MEVDVKNNYMGDTEMGKHLLNKKGLVFLVLLIFVFIFWFQYKNAIYIVGVPGEIYHLKRILFEDMKAECKEAICYYGEIKYNKLLKRVDIRNLYKEDALFLKTISDILETEISVNDNFVYDVSKAEWVLLYDFFERRLFNGYYILNINKTPLGVARKKLPAKIDNPKTIWDIEDKLKYAFMGPIEKRLYKTAEFFKAKIGKK